MKSGKQIFRPKARIIKSLGDELISNEYVAINELVKNSYDAKATAVLIELSEDKIVISDNGVGMTLEQLKKGWFEPATNIKVGKKRLLGEKGSGRFATVKLAKKLNLRTKAKGHNCIVSNFDWEIFNEDENTYLDEIKINWEEKKCDDLTSHGTILTLLDLDADWSNNNKIKDLKVFLSRMINPFDEVKDFKIRLKIGKDISEIVSSEVLNYPHYDVKGQFSDNKIEFVYKGLKIKENVTKNIKNLKLFPCGNFQFIFRIWDRDIGDIKELSEKLKTKRERIKKDLDRAMGVSIYRDKFRVLPYGESNNDWLRLDHRRTQNPTMRLGNNQIVGYISITKEGNKELKDKTSRDGLQENVFYDTFKENIEQILREIEAKRYIERRPKREEIKARSSHQFIKEFNLDDVSKYAKEKYPEDKMLVKKIDKKEAEIIEQGKKFQKLILRYRRLSTLGQLLENVIHEINGSFAGLSTNIGIIENYSKDNQKILVCTSAIRESQKSINQFVNRLKPFAERNRGSKKMISIVGEIKNIIAIKKAEINENKIKVKLPINDVKLSMRTVDLFSIVSNLIDNSIYWLKENNSEKDRQIIIKLKKDSVQTIITFCDNGPNVPIECRESIFDPYFSLKENGTGLGLSIIGEIVSEYGGKFDFIEDNEYQGAAFRITL